MAKVFIQTHTKERFDILHTFLVEKGYENEYDWVEPDAFPFGSFPTALATLIGRSENQNPPDICIVDLRFRNDTNGAEAFDAMDFVLFAAGVSFTPVVYLVQDEKDKKTNNVPLHDEKNLFSPEKTRLIYWNENSSFVDIQDELETAIEQLLKVKSLFPNKKLVKS